MQVATQLGVRHSPIRAISRLLASSSSAMTLGQFPETLHVRF